MTPSEGHEAQQPDPQLEAGSITQWLGSLKEGDHQAAQELWNRYFDRLVRLARQKLKAQRRLGGDADEEDAALSAFESFCDGAAHGRFPMLGDREDLWRLLVVITSRKAGAQAQRRRAKKRGGDRVQVAPQPDHLDYDALHNVVDQEPTPEFAAIFAEEFERLLDQLGDDDLRQVALWRLEGRANDEIAGLLGCARRTVARRLELIRKIWETELE